MAATKYFLYSSKQLKFRKDIELKMGKKFRVGHVIVNGVRKPFTELSSQPTSRFADANCLNILPVKAVMLEVMLVLPKAQIFLLYLM